MFSEKNHAFQKPEASTTGAAYVKHRRNSQPKHLQPSASEVLLDVLRGATPSSRWARDRLPVLVHSYNHIQTGFLEIWPKFARSTTTQNCSGAINIGLGGRHCLPPKHFTGCWVGLKERRIQEIRWVINPVAFPGWQRTKCSSQICTRKEYLFSAGWAANYH